MTGIGYVGLDGPELSIFKSLLYLFLRTNGISIPSSLQCIVHPQEQRAHFRISDAKIRVLGSENLQSVILRGQKEWYRKEKK